MTELEKMLMVIGGLEWCIEHYWNIGDEKREIALSRQKEHIEKLLEKVDINVILECCQKDIYSLL